MSVIIWIVVYDLHPSKRIISSSEDIDKFDGDTNIWNEGHDDEHTIRELKGGFVSSQHDTLGIDDAEWIEGGWVCGRSTRRCASGCG